MKRIAFFISLCLFSLGLQAQTGSIAVIEYIDGDPSEVTITTSDGIVMEGDFGMQVALESTIQTGAATVEIRLDPNGTILNLGEDTLFELTAVQGRRSSDETILTLLQGRLRTIAARSGLNNRYSIKTPTAVCGIRGTDILNSVDGADSFILCNSGSVEVINALNTANRVTIGANQQVNTTAPSFSSLDIPADEVAEIFNQLSFIGLDPDEVPGQTEERTFQEPENEEVASEDETNQANETPQGQEEIQDPANEESTVDPEEVQTEMTEEESDAENTLPANLGTAIPQEPSDEESEAAEPREPSALEEWFSDFMGFELGAVTIDGETWSKVIAQPVIKTEKINLGLYLPVIYRENLLDPSDWYRPEGNDEWSFGTDQDNLQDILLDINEDLWLKIRYAEYGDQLWDPFYVKVGNLQTMSLGHGSLVNNYNNNNDFPSVRKVGLNLGLSGQSVGFEALADDLSSISLTGGRVWFGSHQGFSVGLSGVFDLFPMEGYIESTTQVEYAEIFGNPYVLGLGFDLELFRLNTDLLKLLIYADAATAIPVLREDPTGLEDWQDSLSYIWNGEDLRNFGLSGGVKGQAGIVDFTLDIRYENGLYRHGLFNNLYDRYRMMNAAMMVQELARMQGTNPTAEEPTDSLAIYGEGGFQMLQDKLLFTIAYLYPMEIDGSTITMGDEDYLKLGLEIQKGLIPIYDLSGGIFYERIGFVDSLENNDFSLINAQTVLSGEVVAPLAPTLDLALVVSAATVYDDDGYIQLEDDGSPKIVPVFNIETRIHF